MTYEDEIKRLRAEGKTYDEIRAITGASKSTINYWLESVGKQKTKDRQTSSRASIRLWLKETKENTPCKDCGQYYRYYVMHFDHLPEFEKKFNIGRFKEFTGSLDVVKEEVAKCDLVCGNCHAERTHRRLHPGDDWEDDIFEFELD